MSSSSITPAPAPRFTVFDRKSTDSGFRPSAINLRYWVIDGTTGLMVDEFSSVKAARDARDVFEAGIEPEPQEAPAPAKKSRSRKAQAPEAPAQEETAETAGQMATRILAEKPTASVRTRTAKDKAADKEAARKASGVSKAQLQAIQTAPASDRLAQAAAARFAALPEARRQQIEAVLPAGYLPVWPKGSWTSVKATAEAPADASRWLILCNSHGTTKAIPAAGAADELGKRENMPTWCPGCKKDLTRAGASKAKAQAEAQAEAQEVQLPASVSRHLPEALGGTKKPSRTRKAPAKA
jgi:hypothetical protein